MAEVDHKPNAQGQPGSREPNRAHAAETVDLHKHFMDKLQGEEGQPAPESGEPEGKQEQPRREEQQEQPSGKSQDATDDEANKHEEPSGEESEKYVTEFVDDDNKVVGYADKDGNEYNLDGTPYEADDGKQEEPGPKEDIGALQVDDASYSVDDVRLLVQRNREIDDRNKELDADYRRKTSVMSRLREEYEVSGQEVQAVGQFFHNLSRENLKQLEQIDTKDMTPEEFSAYRSQYDNAKKGVQQFDQTLGQLNTRFKERRNKQLDDAASESAGILKGIEPRWNNEFYAKIRDFAVNSGRYSPEEFQDLHDWRTMEGIISVMDREEVKKIGSGDSSESETIEPGKRKRRRQRQRQKRDARGKFQSSKDTVLQSPNARQDGSLRDHFKAKLAAERERTA